MRNLPVFFLLVPAPAAFRAGGGHKSTIAILEGDKIPPDPLLEREGPVTCPLSGVTR